MPQPAGLTRVALQPGHADVFAAIRAKACDDEVRPVVVPRSARAALLAGLVVGFCLAGLDASRADAMLSALGGIVPGGAPRMLPVMILLGLFGGARAAATNLLCSHWLLRRLRWSGHAAYAVGGGAVATCVAVLTQQLVAHGLVGADLLSSHGVAVDIAAGAAAGFFYRVFAGASAA